VQFTEEKRKIRLSRHAAPYSALFWKFLRKETTYYLSYDAWQKVGVPYASPCSNTGI